MSAHRERVKMLKRVNAHQQVNDPFWLSGYTDGSHHPDTGKGGVGLWVRDNETRILKAIPTPPWAVNSNLVELFGVCAAIETALTELTQEANILVIKTDSQSTANWFGWQGNKSVPKQPEALEMMQHVLELATDRRVKGVVKWVKGHQGTGSVVGYLNNRVDKMARDARLKGVPSRWSCRVNEERKQGPVAQR